MGGGLLAASHNAVTELDDLGHADDRLGMIALIRQKYEEIKDVRY